MKRSPTRPRILGDFWKSTGTGEYSPHPSDVPFVEFELTKTDFIFSAVFGFGQ
jgi:hypothetical protein